MLTWNLVAVGSFSTFGWTFARSQGYMIVKSVKDRLNAYLNLINGIIILFLDPLVLQQVFILCLVKLDFLHLFC